MNIQHLILKKHIFKNRIFRSYNRLPEFNYGEACLASFKNQTFEFVYWRVFRRMIRRKYIKGDVRFKLKKYWTYLVPNIIFSSISTNSRMGAGVGRIIRTAIKLKKNKSFIEFKNYSPFWLKKLAHRTRFRLPLKFGLYFPIKYSNQL